MTCVSAMSADHSHIPLLARRDIIRFVLAQMMALLVALAPARADAIASARSAYAHGDYQKAVRQLTPLALRGDAQAQATLGFMYENGFGAPKAYNAAVGLYIQAANAGIPFAQAMLGLMYDKGHGVRRDVVLAYKWMNIAAAQARSAQRNYFLRLRNAIASKMSMNQIAQGQACALAWTPNPWSGRTRSSPSQFSKGEAARRVIRSRGARGGTTGTP
ncbi:TPR repeat protein [Bradyrhizobium sp. USDA 3311]|uniref:tetratricopeptide repeat protein n=1 Tax=unclassified Bradyrhizobium TaxID=2631580 RepID=UPI001373AC58|nr:sel1 repeat family protein [Bradyrhizobium sp. LCT2]